MNKFSVYFFTCSNNKINFMSADLGQCFVSWLGNWVRIFHPLVQLKKTPENTCWMANLQMVICLSNLLVKILPMLGPVTLRVLDKQDPFCFSVQKFFQSQIVSRLPNVCFFCFPATLFPFTGPFLPAFGPVCWDRTRAGPVKLGKANHNFWSSGPNNWLRNGQVTYSQQETE